MKQPCSSPLQIRNVLFGGSATVVCVPLLISNKEEAAYAASELERNTPDVIEWRGDYFLDLQDTAAIVEAAHSMRNVIRNIPLLYTLRDMAEGGHQESSLATKRTLFKAIIDSGTIDIIDLEISLDSDFINEIRDYAHQKDVKVILSFHDFDATPSESFLMEKIELALKYKADIPKVAVMPQNYGDVLTLLNATYKAKTELTNAPLITISMGNMGQIVRVFGGLFGSDMTFAVGKYSSAPGQLHIDQLRAMIAQAQSCSYPEL